MRNIWLVVKHEIGAVLRQRSFWLLTFLMPAVILGMNVYASIQDTELANVEKENEAAKASEDSTAGPGLVGLVDEAGLVVEIPSAIPEGMFVPFSDATSARAALDAGEIEQYVDISADYIATGDVTVFTKNFKIMQSGEDMGVAFHSANEWMLHHLINTNLTGDEGIVNTLRNPTPGVLAERHVTNPPQEADGNDAASSQVIANVMPFVYYFILVVTSGYIMRGVTAEKENRTIEVLLLSLHPYQLMMGKILGLSLVALAQLGIWVGSSAMIMNSSSDWLNAASLLSPEFIIWAVLFLAFGYLLYASVMAAVGALAPTAREGGQATWLLIIPLMPTLMFSSAFFEEPHGTISMVLSLFPFSAPSAMVTRLAVADVPLWQPLVSLLGLAATSYLFVRLAGRFFRAGNLLSSASFNLRRLATDWRE